MNTEPQISPPETVLLPESQSETAEKPSNFKTHADFLKLDLVGNLLNIVDFTTILQAQKNR